MASENLRSADDDKELVEKATKKADAEESEAHKDKEKDEAKDTDDRKKDIDDDTKKADLAEEEAKKAKEAEIKEFMQALSKRVDVLERRCDDLTKSLADSKDEGESKVTDFGDSAIGW